MAKVATTLETAVLAALDRHGAAVADRTALVNAVSGGLTDPYMVHATIDSLITQGKLTTAVSTTTGKTLISKH